MMRRTLNRPKYISCSDVHALAVDGHATKVIRISRSGRFLICYRNLNMPNVDCFELLFNFLIATHWLGVPNEMSIGHFYCSVHFEHEKNEWR